MPINVEEAVAEIEAEFMRYYEEERQEILKKLGLDKKNRDKLYLCHDNNRIYFSKPRKCGSVEEVSISEYVKRELSKRLELRMTRLEGWEWLAKHCGRVLSKIATDFFLASKMLYFEGGYLYVAGINKPFIVVSISKYSPEIEELLQILRESPYKVDVFVGKELKTCSPDEALEKLKELKSELNR